MKRALSFEEATAMRAQRESGATIRALARQFAVSESTVTRILDQVTYTKPEAAERHRVPSTVGAIKAQATARTLLGIPPGDDPVRALIEAAEAARRAQNPQD